ncbi:MAG TPA: sulfatase-like hydrolase/transferase [Verrucomicrobiae bacterium]|nr:sulfatase-like hydrolase/transferase [Verrucomicrobiae bacterium]
MKRNDAWRYLVAMLAAISCQCSGAIAADAAEAQKPNIVLILTDDVGLGDIGCCGGPFKTPEIDALAKGGMRFECCYSTPLCGPSRCQLLTGRYPFRTGLNSNHSADAVDPKREVMIPTVMKMAGYATASVGKWGQICLGPGEWGFDEYLVFRGSGHYWASQSPLYTVNGQQKDLPADKYLPDVMHEFVVEFIEKHKDGPFFIYYPMSHVHGPILRTPLSKEGATAGQLYTDNVEYMDRLVGKLMAELDRLKLREKTVVLFAGDNGTARFGVEAATVNGKPISGQKGTMLEGGSRVPLVVNWPGVTPPAKVSKDLVDFSDFFATLAELGGAKLPDDVVLDSHSFAPQIRGQTGTPRDWVYVELNGKSYARDGRFKLTNGNELFDLSEAPFREIPVAKETSDEAAIAARKKLQEILVSHPAAPGGPDGKAKRGKGEGRRKKKRQQ